MKRVLVDIDGVVADFVTPVLDIIDKITGVRHPFEAVSGFDMSKALGLSTDQDKALRAEIERKDFCAGLKFLEGAEEGFRKLCEIADVYIVTSPFSGDHWEAERRAWCVKHLGVSKSRVFSGSDKYIVQGDYLVDDRLETCELWEKQPYNGRAIVFDAPWNRRRWDGLRAFSWDDVIDMVSSGA